MDLLEEADYWDFRNRSGELPVAGFEPGPTDVTTQAPPNTTAIPPLKEYDFLNPIWNVAFSATVITGTLGNLIVLWIVLGEFIFHFYVMDECGAI